MGKMIAMKTAPIPPTNPNALIIFGKTIAIPAAQPIIKVVAKVCSKFVGLRFTPMKEKI